MKTARFLSAGLIDAGFASVSTFAIGVYAARTLSTGDLGVFALHFSAFLFVSTLSHQGVFIPLEAQASGSGRPLRFGLRSLSLSWVSVALAPVLLLLVGVAAPGSVPLGLGLWAVAAVALSPLQDHLRRFHHLLGLSWRAAGISLVQAVAIGVALVQLHSRLEPILVPFAALALANFVSLATAVVLLVVPLLRDESPAAAEALPGLSALLGSGRWLLGAQMSAAAAAFLAAAAVGRLASMEALGLADAARIVARPVLVLTTGMTAVLGPRLMRAGVAGADEEGRALGGLYRRAIALSVVAYVLFFGWSHPWNPLAWLVPAAYELPLLVLVTCVANGLLGSVVPARFEAIGGGRSKALLRVDLWAAGVQVLAATLAGLTQAFTIPLGKALFAGVRSLGLRGLRAEVYRDGARGVRDEDAREPSAPGAAGPLGPRSPHATQGGVPALGSVEADSKVLASAGAHAGAGSLP